MLDICYHSPSQDDKADETLFQLPKENSGQHNLLLTSNFHYSDICWESNTVVHKSSIMFQEYTEDWFLLQRLDLPTRNSTMLDLLVTNQEHLLDNIITNGTPRYNKSNLWRLRSWRA